LKLISNRNILLPPHSELFQPNFQDMMSISNIMTNEMWAQSGARYRTTSEANAAGFVSGTSGDYAAGQDQIPFVYTIYAERGGPNGYDVPEASIKRIVDEIFFGVVALADHVSTLPMPDPIE
jgi:hypothetical protein